MVSTSTQPILPIVRQHVEEAIMLRHQRSGVLRRPDVGLEALKRLDERLAAHLDGVAVAGEAGRGIVNEQVAEGGAGALFVATVCALQSRDADALPRLVGEAMKSAASARGWLSALGWVSAQDLQGTVRALLGSKVAVHRGWALSACVMHRVDPGALLLQALQDADVAVRAQAWHAAGCLGRDDLADAARQVIAGGSAASPPPDEHATVLMASASAGLARADGQAERRAAAWALTRWQQGGNELVRQMLLAPPAAALDGQPGLPLEALHRMAVLAAPVDWGREQVRELATRAEGHMPLKRRLLRMAAWVGDVQILPWLIHQMDDDGLARLAGESFCLITGLDLVREGLVRATPGQAQTGPTERPEDADVALEEDEGLPWPDRARVQAWWGQQAGGFVQGQRYVAGQPPRAPHLLSVLAGAGQRQRQLAAEHLALLKPASHLFAVAAPAWRQHRWLKDDTRAQT